jgi:hypothetical protein
MQLPQAILIFVDDTSSAITAAAATVLSTLLQIDKILLPNEVSTQNKRKFPKQSLLLLSHDQINKLAMLRLLGFDGAVLVLSSDPFNVLKEQYGILRWGQGSHDACPPAEKLTNFLEKLAELGPMEPENLNMLQKELKAPRRWFTRRVTPCIKRLEKAKETANQAEAIASLTKLVEELRAITPVACHAVVEIEGDRAQIQQHFQILLEKISKSGSYDETQIALIRQIFTKWRDLVMQAGEGLGAFS